MKQQTQALCLSLLVIAIIVVVDAALPGSWTPIKDLKDKHIVEIAEFAVTEHNKRVKSDLKLDGIVKGESQVVAGINYRLVLTVLNGGGDSKYGAIVYENLEHLKTLESFVPLNNA